MINPALNQKGTTLIEVLIAAIIIGIGLLGIASLQVKALQASTNAEQRAKAIDLAWELADRIRTNVAADNSYVTGNTLLSSCPTAAGVPTCSMSPGGSAIAQSDSCTPQQIAAEDLEQIYCGIPQDGARSGGIKEALSGGTLQITCTDIDPADTDTCSPGSKMTITITWNVRNDVFGTGKDHIVMPVIPGEAQ